MKRFTVIGLIFCLGLGSLEGMARQQKKSGLRILLTNDQGNTRSFRMLRDRLTAAGHKVKAYIPSGAVGSFGSAFTGRDLNVIRLSPNTWKVENDTLIDTNNDERFPATPVECLQVGLKQYGEHVDLIVSGFNDPTYSAGSFSLFSGGIGAAMVGTMRSQAYNSKVPSIAVSISGEPSASRVSRASQFIINLIDKLHLTRDEESRLLPPFTTLSINIPGGHPNDPLKDQRVAGVSMNLTGITASAELDEEMLLSANNTPDVGTLIIDSKFADIPFSDTTDRNLGWVTMVVMHPDLTASSIIYHSLSKRLKDDILSKREPENDLCMNLDCFDEIVDGKKKTVNPIRKTRITREAPQAPVLPPSSQPQA